MTDYDSSHSCDGVTVTTFTSDIVSAYVSNTANYVSAQELPGLIKLVAGAINDILFDGGGPEVEPVPLTPAVSIKKSVTPDYLICLEDGKKLKMLKRHLATRYGMTPDEYRAKWGLKDSYPMVAPNYAEARSKLAVELGLGRKPSNQAEAA